MVKNSNLFSLTVAAFLTIATVFSPGVCNYITPPSQPEREKTEQHESLEHVKFPTTYKSGGPGCSECHTDKALESYATRQKAEGIECFIHPNDI